MSGKRTTCMATSRQLWTKDSVRLKSPEGFRSKLLRTKASPLAAHSITTNFWHNRRRPTIRIWMILNWLRSNALTLGSVQMGALAITTLVRAMATAGTHHLTKWIIVVASKRVNSRLKMQTIPMAVVMTTLGRITKTFRGVTLWGHLIPLQCLLRAWLTWASKS